ncbi:LmeA family phospholipid-binding protein [Saccharomonospora piscinae]|uniref:LmeA family phospholipid-binding protein n=1 Tax=Saccharomonospora piscinae TaxID=687388 RepID=UPI000466F894|nr:DUF2993 domain-containing protein [Saccharomonospora piscinae]
MNTAVTGTAQAGGTKSRRRGKRIVIVLVVLVGLLVGADFAAATYAEHTVSQKAREQLGLSQDPAVTIHGFPFATQALAGEYDHIALSADGVGVQQLRDLSVRADLHDVDAPLSDLTSGNVSDIAIGRLTGEITLKASDIAGVAPLTNIDDLSIEPSSKAYVLHGEGVDDERAAQIDDDGDDSSEGVRLSGKVDVAGERIEIFAFAMIELEGTTIRITPHRLQFGNDQETTVVPDEVQQALLPNFEADINAGEMPFTVTPTAVRVESGSLTLHGEARDVTFAGVAGAFGG